MNIVANSEGLSNGVNMIVHRDYRDSSGSIIKIYDNRIEFYNPGKLYGGITIDDLLSGNYTSRSRNKLIAKAFKEVGLIERYGSGINRIRRICKEYSVVEPAFNEISNGFQVILFKEKLNEPVNEPANEPVNDRQKEIISLIHQNNSISINELSKICKVGRETIKRDLNKLKNMNLIQRIGPDKGGYWKVLKS